MSDRLDDALMEDLGYDEGEGASEMLGAEDEYDLGEEELGDEEFLGSEEGFDEGFEADGFDAYADFGEEGEADFEEAMAYALGADDSDEFFRRLVGVLRRAAPVVGRIARTAAPIARLIPHPAAQIAAQGLGLLGRLQADGASEDEALEAFAELAVDEDAALPIVAGLAARSLLRRTGARLPMQARRQVVRTLTTAANTLAQRRGPSAVRALPRIVVNVRRAAAQGRTPPRATPRIAARTAVRVARSPALARRLSAPLPRGRQVLRRAGSRARTFTFQGPVRISIQRA